MWGDNKFPEGVVFLDKEPRLMIKPDILTTWDKIPYPNDYFSCCIFDPPHTWFGESSIHNNPVRIEGKRGATWWGNPGSEVNLVRDIIKGQREIARVSPVICFKWNEVSVSLEKILTCFTEWREVYRMEYKSQRKTGNSKTWFVRLHRKGEVSR